jgi:hypothetical protein
MRHRRDCDCETLVPNRSGSILEALTMTLKRPYRWIALPLLLVLLLVMRTSDVWATKLVPVSVENMTAIATDVVLGTCLSVDSRWTDDHKQILTYVTLTNVEPLKGNAKGDVTFVQLGGRVGDDLMEAVGAPSFEVGEEVVVFLKRMPNAKSLAYDTDLWLFGLGRGKWKIATDSQTGERIATMSTGAAQVVGKTAQDTATSSSLSELIARIKSVAALSGEQ